MSDLLKSFASYIRVNPVPNLRVISSADLTEDEPEISDALPKTRTAKLVDPKGSIDGVSVGNACSGSLCYFLDGIERRHIPAYFDIVPIVYGYVAAAIRFRGPDKLMRLYKPSSIEALFIPYRLIDPSKLQSFGIKTIDIESDEQQLDNHPMALKEGARKAISKERGRLEDKLVREWLENNEGGSDWLVVDGSLGGTLGGDYQKYEAPNIIGLIKSHSTQYFPIEEQRKILSLKEGERSGIFMPIGREDRAPVYSWYIRLRSNEGRDVYFGLIRVEAPACDRTLEMADEISRWLLAERCPLSLPDARWDKMIYPIRDCEQYLKSIAPTRTVLEASMAALSGQWVS